MKRLVLNAPAFLLLAAVLSGCAALAPAQTAPGFVLASSAKEQHPNGWTWQLEFKSTAPLPLAYSDSFVFSQPIHASYAMLTWRSRGCDLVLLNMRRTDDGAQLLNILAQGDQNQTLFAGSPGTVEGLQVEVSATASCQFEFVYTGTNALS